MSTPGNQNARKHADHRLDSQLVIRCTRAEKGAWVRAAHPRKLASWVRSILTREAKQTTTTRPGGTGK